MENSIVVADVGTAINSRNSILKRSARWLFIRPLRTWTIFFSFVLLLTFQPGGPNSSARLLAMYSLIETQTAEITRYHKLTIDWARTPDGKYYSNKAPGPIFLGLPVLWGIDRAMTGGMKTMGERDNARIQVFETVDRILSFLMQTFPLFLLFAAWLQVLRTQSVKLTAMHWVVLAGLLGNTLTLMTSTYYGHAMTAAFLLGTGLAVWHGNLFWAFFTWGFAVLCEYSVAVVLIPLTACFWSQIKKSPLPSLGKIALAGLIPGALWIWYHLHCFGGIFALPNKFQNPAFVDKANYSLWGIFGMPNPMAVIYLLFGTARGILWTQPWMIVLFATPLFLRQFPKLAQWNQSQRGRIAFLTMTSFALLLVINAAFGNWDAGAVAGPRYLSPVFGLMAVLVGLYWSDFSLLQKRWMKASIVAAVVFHLAWLGMNDFPDMHPLWLQIFARTGNGAFRGQTLVALASIGTFVFLLNSWNQRQKPIAS
jgi:hypothetical protein